MRVRCSVERVNFTRAHAHLLGASPTFIELWRILLLCSRGKLRRTPVQTCAHAATGASVGWRRARGASACAAVHVIMRGEYALAPQASLGKARRKRPFQCERRRSSAFACHVSLTSRHFPTNLSFPKVMGKLVCATCHSPQDTSLRTSLSLRSWGSWCMPRVTDLKTLPYEPLFP